MASPAYDDIPLGNMAPGQPGVPRGYANHANGSGSRGIDFFKPKDSFKVYNRVLLGVAILLMVGMISLGVALGVERAHYNQLKAMLPVGSEPDLGGSPPFGSSPTGSPPITYPTQTSYPATPLTGLTGLDLWNSTDCTTPNGNCTALLDIPQVNECFQLVWGVCHGEYNTTNPFPQKNNPIFVNNPQCNNLIFQMYCEWESDVNSTIPCPPMANFCVDEFIVPGDFPATPSINTSGMIMVTTTGTVTVVEQTAVGTVTTLVPVATHVFTRTVLESPTPTPVPTANSEAFRTSGSSFD